MTYLCNNNNLIFTTMFYKKRIEALETRVENLEIKVAALAEKARVQSNEIEMLWAQFAGLAAPQNPLPEPKPTPKPRRRRRKTNGKEANTTHE